MSTYFRVRCDYPCEEDGPQIGRMAGGMTFADPQLNEHKNGIPAGDTLAAFLIQHEYCELKLVHE